MFSNYSSSIYSGAKYKRHSTLAVPLLRRAKIISNLDTIIDYTDRLLAKWRNNPIDIHTNIVQNCENLILEIFSSIAFNYDLKILDNSNENGNNEFIKALHDFLSTFKIITYLPRILSIICLRLYPRHQRAQKTIEKYLYQAMDQELIKSENSIEQQKKKSLLASLVNSLQKDEKAEALKNEDEKQGKYFINFMYVNDEYITMSKFILLYFVLFKGLSRKEILDEMLAFLIAGYDTTSTVLAWFIHLMSKHPRVQQKIKAELMVDSTSEDLTLDRIDSLTYLDCVINEVFRFIIPVSGTVRMVYIDDCLPTSGVHLSKNTQVFIPFYNLARDSRLWSIDPNIFYPERFLNEDKDHHSHALIPFGGGHRQCVGQDLSRFQLKVIIARLMQHVTFGDGGPQINLGGFISGVTEKPRHIGVTIKFDT